MAEIPVNRWIQEGGEAQTRYLERFLKLIDSGEDIDGEARLADAISPRGAQILDAGAGFGRVAAYLAGAGHEVVACEPDPVLVARGRELYPGLRFLEKDILALEPGDGSFDTIVLVGNVLVFAAANTQRQLLDSLRSLLRPEGRILVGFHLNQGPALNYPYPIADFEADVAAVGLQIQSRFSSYQLDPSSEDYLVAILRLAGQGND